MMGSSSISQGDLQQKVFRVNNENEGMKKKDWTLPIIEQDITYRKSNFQLKKQFPVPNGVRKFRDKNYKFDEKGLLR